MFGQTDVPSRQDIEKNMAESQGRGAVDEQRTEDGVQVIPPIGHNSEIDRVSISPDSHYVLSQDVTGVTTLWDVAGHRQLRTFHDSVASFTRNSNPVVVYDAHQGVVLYDAVAQQQSVVLAEQTAAVSFAASDSPMDAEVLDKMLRDKLLVSADGRVGVAPGQAGQTPRGGVLGILGPSLDDASLTVIDIPTGRRATLPVKGYGAAPVALSDDGAILLSSTTSVDSSGSPNIEYVLWDLKTRAQRHKVSGDRFARVPVLTADGRFVATQNDDCSIDTYAVADGGTRRLAPAQSVCPLLTFVVSPDGRWLANKTNTSIDIYDLRSGQRARSLKPDLISTVPQADTVVFSPDGGLLARMQTRYTLVKKQQQVEAWDVASGRQVAKFEASAFAFSQDGKTVVLARGSGSPILRELATGRESTLGNVGAAVAEVVMSADGRYAVAGSRAGGAKLWDLTSGLLSKTLDCPDGAAASSVSLNSRAALAATGCQDGSALLWDLKTGQSIRSLAKLPANATSAGARVRFSDDGELLVVALKEQIMVWNATGTRQIRQFTLPRGALPATTDPQRMMADARKNNEAALAQIQDKKLRAKLAEGFEKGLRDSEKLQEQSAANVALMDPGKGGPAPQQAMEAYQERFHYVGGLAIQPGNRWIAISKPYELSLWDLQTGKRVKDLDHGDLDPEAIAKMAQAGGTGLSTRLTRRVRDRVRTSLGDEGVNLAFTPDGRVLLVDGERWDVASGTELERAPPQMKVDASGLGNMFTMKKKMKELNDSVQRQMSEQQSQAAARTLAQSTDGRFEVQGLGRELRIARVDTNQELARLRGHTGDVQFAALSGDGKTLLSAGQDGSLRVWNLTSRTAVASLIALGGTDFVTVTPDQYYRASRSGLTGMSFSVKGTLYPFEQFDLRFNRPDIVLERLGRAQPNEILSYRRAYDRRLKKMGFTAAMLAGDFHLPSAEILGGGPAGSTTAASVQLRVRVADDKYPLDRINLYVNDVPIYGSAGLPVADKQARSAERTVEVPLVPGRNKIQVSALNQQGVESLRQTTYTTATGRSGGGDIYVVAIGVSKYRDSKYNLRFAAKDAADVMNLYRGAGARGGSGSQTHLLDLTDEKATKTGIAQAREWLKQTHPNDLVILFAAGHGITDAQQDYYFGTYDIDPSQPQVNGLPYEQFEALLDGIPALRKLLLLDTCFSGEIDKEAPTVVAEAAKTRDGVVKMRAFRAVNVVAEESAAQPSVATGTQHFEDLFADLRRGTGAVVISSASGNEYALEGEQWKNGVFTYALLNGLKSGKADANHDGTVSVGELQAYMIEEVRRLTAGGQNPTVRRENLDFDFTVY